MAQQNHEPEPEQNPAVTAQEFDEQYRQHLENFRGSELKEQLGGICSSCEVLYQQVTDLSPEAPGAQERVLEILLETLDNLQDVAYFLARHLKSNET